MKKELKIIGLVLLMAVIIILGILLFIFRENPDSDINSIKERLGIENEKSLAECLFPLSEDKFPAKIGEFEKIEFPNTNFFGTSAKPIYSFYNASDGKALSLVVLQYKNISEFEKAKNQLYTVPYESLIIDKITVDGEEIFSVEVKNNPVRQLVYYIVLEEKRTIVMLNFLNCIKEEVDSTFKEWKNEIC